MVEYGLINESRFICEVFMIEEVGIDGYSSKKDYLIMDIYLH